MTRSTPSLALFAGLALLAAAPLRAGEPPRPTPTPFPTRTPTPTPTPRPLWGFADLHAHPASHLGFGANDGNAGVFYGAPGKTANAGEIVNLKPCDADKHSSSFDLVEDGTQVSVFTALDGSTGANHTTGGFPDFEGWPSARSLTHQQMHVDWLRRAWAGGLRLMVASATDNKLLSALWANSAELPNQWDLAQYSDYDSAKKQLQYITEMVAANDWMAIAKNAADAEKLIANGKLAVVLGLEMDDLTPEQILSLRDQFGVVVVNPIHLADNPSFGGSGVYSNLFNTMNREVWGYHYDVRTDPSIGYRLSAPLKMGTDVLPLLQPPFVFKDYVTTSDGSDSACGADNRYEFCHVGDVLTVDGHANAHGLFPAGKGAMTQLFKRAMIVDIAHMSDLSQRDTLELAARLTVPMPVIDSHTDLRVPLGGLGSHAVTERKLLPKHASAIRSVGGMIGLGTEGDIQARTISREQNSPLARISTGQTFFYDLDNPRLRLGIGTGEDNLEDKSKVRATVTIGGVEHVIGWLKEPHNDLLEQNDLEELEELSNHSIHWVTVKLPAGTKLSEVQKLKLELVQENPSCQLDCDNWKVDRFEVYYLSRAQAARLYSKKANPYLHYFKAHNDNPPLETPDWTVSLAPDGREVVDVEMTTGNDAVDDGKGWLALQYVGGGVNGDIWDNALTPTNGMFSGLYFERPVVLPAGRTVADIQVATFGINPAAQIGCQLSCDNWDLSSIRISQPNPLGTRVVLERSSAPAFRFTGTDPTVSLAVRLETEPPILPPSITAPNPDVQWVEIAVQTETDDLQRDMQVTGTLQVDGLTVPPFSLNQGAKWFDGTSHLTIVKLPAPVKVSAIRRLDIHLDGPKQDDWKIGSVEIHALGKPIAGWYEQYQTALGLMGGKGIAIGTDLNGLNPLVPFSEVPVAYPLAPPVAPAGYSPLATAQTSGNRVFDFELEGISNVGQLPEFMQAVQNASGVPASTAPLFRSAGDFVEMWKKVEAAAAAMNP